MRYRNNKREVYNLGDFFQQWWNPTTAEELLFELETGTTLDNMFSTNETEES